MLSKQVKAEDGVLGVNTFKTGHLLGRDKVDVDQVGDSRGWRQNSRSLLPGGAQCVLNLPALLQRYISVESVQRASQSEIYQRLGHHWCKNVVCVVLRYLHLQKTRVFPVRAHVLN